MFWFLCVYVCVPFPSIRSTKYSNSKSPSWMILTRNWWTPQWTFISRDWFKRGGLIPLQHWWGKSVNPLEIYQQFWLNHNSSLIWKKGTLRYFPLYWQLQEIDQLLLLENIYTVIWSEEDPIQLSSWDQFLAGYIILYHYFGWWYHLVIWSNMCKSPAKPRFMGMLYIRKIRLSSMVGKWFPVKKRVPQVSTTWGLPLMSCVSRPGFANGTFVSMKVWVVRNRFANTIISFQVRIGQRKSEKKWRWPIMWEQVMFGELWVSRAINMKKYKDYISGCSMTIYKYII